MREVTMYVDKTGFPHRDPRHALRADGERELLARANRMFERGATLAEALSVATNIHSWPSVLSEITSETRILIEHWQCSKRPAYRVERIESGGVFCGGSGGPDGYYGDRVTIRDLVRYAEGTKAEHGSLGGMP